MQSWQPNRGQTAVLKRFFSRPGEEKQLVVLGGPGTGKTTLLKAIARGLVAMGEQVIIIAEYNTQVLKLQVELRGDGLTLPVQTRAGLYQMANAGKPKPQHMLGSMKEAGHERIERASTKLEDEFALGGPARIDACDAVDAEIRNGRPLNRVKFGDLFQGNPILDEADVESIPGSNVAPRGTLSIEGKWFQDPKVEVLTLDEAERFKGEDVEGRVRETRSDHTSFV